MNCERLWDYCLTMYMVGSRRETVSGWALKFYFCEDAALLPTLMTIDKNLTGPVDQTKSGDISILLTTSLMAVAKTSCEDWGAIILCLTACIWYLNFRGNLVLTFNSVALYQCRGWQNEKLQNRLSFLKNFNNEKQVKAINGADVTVLESTVTTEYCLGSLDQKIYFTYTLCSRYFLNEFERCRSDYKL